MICNEKTSFLICETCLSKLDTGFNRCDKCSSPIPSKGYCSVCLKEKRYFTKGFSLFNYGDENIPRIIELFKFHGIFGLANILDKFSDVIREVEFFGSVDYLIPVPMHSKSIRKRGFNQAVSIAKKLGKITGIPVCFDCVIKVRRTKSQVGLRLAERKKNLKDAFDIHKLKNHPKRIVIVDDVFTTGSTVNEIARLLRKHSIESYFFTLASTPQIV